MHSGHQQPSCEKIKNDRNDKTFPSVCCPASSYPRRTAPHDTVYGCWRVPSTIATKPAETISPAPPGQDSVTVIINRCCCLHAPPCGAPSWGVLDVACGADGDTRPATADHHRHHHHHHHHYHRRLVHPVIRPSCRRPCLASKWRPAASAFLMAPSSFTVSLLMLASRIIATISLRMSGSGG